MRRDLNQLLKKLAIEGALICYEDGKRADGISVETAFAVSPEGNRIYLIQAGMRAEPLTVPLPILRELVADELVRVIETDKPYVTTYALTDAGRKIAASL